MPLSPTHQRAQGTLYHAFVPSPCGDHLLPLNEMRTRYPDLHRRHHAKYRDREGVLLQPVPPLDPAHTCIRLMRKSATRPGAELATPDDFLPFTTGTLRAVARVTDAALTRLRNLKPDDPLLPWVDVPHVLHRGPIPISFFTEPTEDT